MSHFHCHSYTLHVDKQDLIYKKKKKPINHNNNINSQILFCVRTPRSVKEINYKILIQWPTLYKKKKLSIYFLAREIFFRGINFPLTKPLSHI